MTNARDIFESLRIPDAIKYLQPFDGNPSQLADFIKNVEEVLLVIHNTNGTPYGQLLLRAIRNRITGEANVALNTHMTPLNWDSIKSTLINLYADNRPESTIINELHGIKQNNKTIEEFYKEIMGIHLALLNNVLLKETKYAVQQAKKDLYQKVSLDVFLIGLKEPLGGIVRAMKPTNLSEALGYCQKEQAIRRNKFNPRNINPNQNNYQPNNYQPNNYPNNRYSPYHNQNNGYQNNSYQPNRYQNNDYHPYRYRNNTPQNSSQDNRVITHNLQHLTTAQILITHSTKIAQIETNPK